MFSRKQRLLTPAPLLGGEGGEGWPFRLSHARRSPTVLACPRKREAGVGIVADGGTYKNAGFPIKAVGNDSKDPCGNDRLAALPTPLLAFPAPPSDLPPLLLSFPRFLAGIHGRVWRPRILVIEESVARLNTGSRGAACSRGRKGPSPRPLSQGEREGKGGLFASLMPAGPPLFWHARGSGKLESGPLQTEEHTKCWIPDKSCRE